MFLFSIYFLKYYFFYFYNSGVTLTTLTRKHEICRLYPCSYNNNNNLHKCTQKIIVIVTHNLSHFLCNISPDISSLYTIKTTKKSRVQLVYTTNLRKYVRTNHFITLGHEYLLLLDKTCADIWPVFSSIVVVIPYNSNHGKFILLSA